MQYLVSFLEGIITFISPCLLPMLPIYICYFAGSGEPKMSKTVSNSVSFVLGFTLSFVLMGALASVLGSFFIKYKVIVNIVTGLVVIFFGLNFLGVFKFNLFSGTKAKVDTSNLNIIKSFIFGLVFSIGWTPCVGAFLGSALMLASQAEHVKEGMLMLFVYSMGLGLPFILSAILIDSLKSTIDWIKKHYDVINKVCGIFLILIGLLMAVGLMDKILGWLS